MAELRRYGETMAHELREPLERIDDFCRALRTEWAESAPRSALLHVETIGANSREMAARIAMLRRMPELLTRGLELRLVDLDTMVRPLLAPHVEEQASRHIRIELGQLGKATADPLLLSEAFRILLDNAVTSTRGKDAPRITVERIADQDRIVISIHDNGSVSGSAPREVRFDPLTAVPGAQGLEERSLGLALCSRILARHGGGLRATGEPGSGTCFVLWLPHHAPDGE
jgi:light-regulated signal transduction histidine kinase (bacteriophytochrome)